MTIIPRALVSHQLRCDVQDCQACGGDHVGVVFYSLPKPYGNYTKTSMCPAILATGGACPILMTEAQAGPFATGKDE